MSPERVGKYRLEAPLGESAQSVVYRAVAEDTGQTVAVRLVPPEHFLDEDSRKRFIEEARAAIGLSHPHLRQLYEVEEADGQLYLVMEYLEGATLKSVLVSGRVETETGLAWGAEIAEALAAAHEQGIVHGDLRPAKIFITKEGTVKVLDAGLWRLTHRYVDFTKKASPPEVFTTEATAAYSISYLSPEQVVGKRPQPASDVFVLGMLLYELLTGGHPFRRRNLLGTTNQVLRGAPPPLALEAAPPGLEELLGLTMQKDAGSRLSAEDFAVSLRALAAGEEIPIDVSPTRWLVRLSSPLWLAIGFLILLLVAWFAYLALTQ